MALVPCAVAALALLASSSALAHEEASTLSTVVVTGNPLGSNELIAPAEQYSGDELLLRSKSTLGETLDGTPGVSSTYFGPNASRPSDPRARRRPHPHPEQRRRQP